MTVRNQFYRSTGGEIYAGKDKDKGIVLTCFCVPLIINTQLVRCFHDTITGAISRSMGIVIGEDNWIGVESGEERKEK
jgi:hypothetical protein